MEKKDLLKQCLLFENLVDSEIEAILDITMVQDFQKEEIIFKKDEEGDALYLIIEGAVRVSVILDSIGEEVLAILRKGSHFGEISFARFSTF